MINNYLWLFNDMLTMITYNMPSHHLYSWKGGDSKSLTCQPTVRGSLDAIFWLNFCLRPFVFLLMGSNYRTSFDASVYYTNGAILYKYYYHYHYYLQGIYVVVVLFLLCLSLIAWLHSCIYAPTTVGHPSLSLYPFLFFVLHFFLSLLWDFFWLILLDGHV